MIFGLHVLTVIIEHLLDGAVECLPGFGSERMTITKAFWQEEKDDDQEGRKCGSKLIQHEQTEGTETRLPASIGSRLNRLERRGVTLFLNNVQAAAGCSRRAM